MAANVSFKVTTYIEPPELLPERAGRMADLSPAFASIIPQFVAENEQKFEQSVGAELGGARVFGEPWAALTPAYMREKHREGRARVTRKAAKGGAAHFEGPFPDWLMVRSGALREALIDPDSVFQYFDEQQAIFGMPIDEFLADLVVWQSHPRQKNRYVVFLSQPDMNIIKQVLQDYLGLGGDFQEIRTQAGLAAVALKQEQAELDAGFEFAAGGE